MWHWPIDPMMDRLLSRGILCIQSHKTPSSIERRWCQLILNRGQQSQRERIVSGSKNINPVKSQKKTQKLFSSEFEKKNQTCVKVKWADESKRNESFTRAQMIFSRIILLKVTLKYCEISIERQRENLKLCSRQCFSSSLIIGLDELRLLCHVIDFDWPTTFLFFEKLFSVYSLRN